MRTMEQRYRVNANVRGLRRGQVVLIDDEDDGWAPYIERGFLVAAPDDGDVPADTTHTPALVGGTLGEVDPTRKVDETVEPEGGAAE